MGVKSLAVGLVAGYVLGAKAGHSRYEQISKYSSKVWNSKPIQAGVSKAHDAAGQAVHSAKAKVGRGRDDVGEETVTATPVDF
ncbi:MAG: hypothetical protein Q3979_09930 [Actinomycetaceae bacterium]|nr:hypothetical protein [Actinomycetaceae bacterium]